MLDTGGQPVRADALLTKFLLAQRGHRMLIATLDDLAAIYARNAITLNGRQSGCIIASQGCDHNIHGGINEKKELEPTNRGSVVLGSVAYFMDRYGYDVLPLALAAAGRRRAAAVHPDAPRPDHGGECVPGISAVRYQLVRFRADRTHPLRVIKSGQTTNSIPRVAPPLTAVVSEFEIALG